MTRQDLALTPARYEAWYHSPRGRWIAAREFALLYAMLAPAPASSILDLGSGTGHFSRRFAEQGHRVVSLDPDATAVSFAATQAPAVPQLRARAEMLPLADNSVDYAMAVTSLCFVDDPVQALREMWRVSRFGIGLVLLNRRSLLHARKHGRGGYRGARWDRAEDLKDWCESIDSPCALQLRSGIFLPGGSRIARYLENRIPSTWLYGGVLAAVIRGGN